MNNKSFNDILEARIINIRNTLEKKAVEYAVGDRLYNFKRAAEISRTTAERALYGMFLKHLVSVIDLVEGNLENSKTNTDEKIGDAINYLILLEAVLTENRFNLKCVECGQCSCGEIP